MAGGPIAVVREGDLIAIDIPSRRLDILIDKEELEKRLASLVLPPPKISHGYMARYVRQVTSASRGATLKQ